MKFYKWGSIWAYFLEQFTISIQVLLTDWRFNRIKKEACILIDLNTRSDGFQKRSYLIPFY